MAMINAKEAQQYVYSMFIDGILTAEVCLNRRFDFLKFSLKFFHLGIVESDGF
jgi:hypothetical protein